MRRVGNGFVPSINISIYRHDYGAYTYVLYHFAEGLPESPVWVLTQFGNNQGANAIAPDHNFLSAVGMHGTHIQLYIMYKRAIFRKRICRCEGAA